LTASAEVLGEYGQVQYGVVEYIPRVYTLLGSLTAKPDGFTSA